MTLKERVMEKKREILEIARKYGAGKVRIFGSVARNTAVSGSDLDLLIELEAGRTLFDIIAIKQDLEELLGCSVDVVTEAAVSPYIRAEVLKSAVNL